jgi:hypothetical protein
LFNSCAAVLFFSIYFLWLLIFFVLGVIGFFIPISERRLTTSEVLNTKTVCKVLFEKGKLSLEDYHFETTEVSSCYSSEVFLGYKVIMLPVILTAAKCNFLDNAILYLVKRWIRVHKWSLGLNETKPPKLHIFLKFFCVSIARNVGCFLQRTGITRVFRYFF